jgi:hypothetical protein
MTTDPVNRGSTRRGWVLAIAGGAALLALAYVLWAAYLALMAGEGAVPPGSRLPDVPSGAQVVSETEQCASGGCWREVVVRPADGTSPEELASQMGVSAEERYSWQLLDPHSVSVGSTVNGSELSVYVRY